MADPCGSQAAFTRVRNETLCHHLSVRKEIARVRGKKIIVTGCGRGMETAFLPTLGPGKSGGLDMTETGQQLQTLPAPHLNATLYLIDVADAARLIQP